MSRGAESAPRDPAWLGRALLRWYERHGRKSLPWQVDRTPYRVWISEIMLQQTQVATVLDYFQRFVKRFPDLDSLARAPVDEVLHLWTGLGYYARARNLHRTARIVAEAHAGALPEDVATLQSLPGIGRSTAGAILALSRDQRHPILDGNARRVLCRVHAVEGWPGQAGIERHLWSLAEAHTPRRRVREYTQAIMDLGATVCTRTRPRCEQCPARAGCRARAAGTQQRYPHRRPRGRAARRRRALVFVVVRDEAGAFLLSRRPPSGIWGGLWSFPEIATDEDPLRWCERHLGARPEGVERLPVIHHGFTHFDLDIHPVLVRPRPGPAPPPAGPVMEGAQSLWYNPSDPERLGLPAPVAGLLTGLSGRSGGAG